MAKDVKFNIKLQVDGKDVVVQASTNVKQLANDLGLVHDRVTAADKAFMKWTQSVVAIGAVTNSIQQISDVLNTLTEDSRTFGAAMKAANTMAGKDAEGFEQLKDQVAELSKTIPMTRDALANGLYQVISNGVPEDNWISYLEASSRAAVGGIADVGEVVKVTSTVIKNYGLEWSAAKDIQDKIQLTAKNGVTSFDQLAAALPSVTGQAAQLGVSFTEMLAVMSTLTGVTGNTSEVATQLASVLTALTKESSNSQKMAEEMGISFNAASIKAAGGLRNYLQELDRTVTAYAQKSGQLKESIYSNLFGRAEALRLVNGLTGEMAAKFDENIAALDNSAGTIDKAFETMSSTGSATTQMLKNQFAAFTDLIAGIVGGIQPYLNFTSQMGMTILSVTSLTKAIKGLNIAHTLMIARTKAGGVAMLAFGLRANRAAAFSRVFSAALKGAAFQATAAKIAIRGLMIATGVTLALVALTEALSLFNSEADKTDAVTEAMTEAEDAYKSKMAETQMAVDDDIKKLQELINAKKDTTDEVRNLNTKYGELLGTYQSGAEWLTTLKNKSDDYCQQLAIEAKTDTIRRKIFEKNADLMVIAEKKRRLEDAGNAKRQMTVSNNGAESAEITVMTPEYRGVVDEERKLTGELEKLQGQFDLASAAAEKHRQQMQHTKIETQETAKEVSYLAMSYSELETAIEKQKKKIGKYAGASDKAKADGIDVAAESRKLQQMEARYKQLGKKYHLGSQSDSRKRQIVADPKTLEQLRTNIELSKKKLTGQDTDEQRQLQQQIALWQKKADAIDLAQKKAALPASIESQDDAQKTLDYLNTARRLATTKEQIADIDRQIAAVELKQAEMKRPADSERIATLQDIDKELNYQRALRKTAAAENIAQIDATINRLETLKSYTEHADVISMDNKALQTYDQLSIKLSYYRDQLKTATEEERAQIQTQIIELEKLRNKWDATLEAMKKPGPIGTLKTIEDLDNAISYYGQLQKHQSADEIAATQQVIQALETKKKAMQRPIELAGMQKEIDEINALSGREFKVKIKGIGFDALTDKIRELKKALNDIDNPPTENQRKQIEGMIAVYESWRKKSISSFDTARNGWDGIKGIGNSIQSITDALEGNGNAWQKTVALIDAFIGLYDGIQAVIGIINLLSAASSAHAVTKGVEAGAETTEATTREAATAANIIASTAQIAANKLETASWAELAAAITFAAHAYIPFAGTAIASGMIAAQQAAIIAAGIPKYEKGALAFGPTLGIFGEYAGASHNPEVVAPLDKLRSMIEPSSGFSGEVEFVIKGRRLVGVLNKEDKINKRS